MLRDEQSIEELEQDIEFTLYDNVYVWKGQPKNKETNAQNHVACVSG